MDLSAVEGYLMHREYPPAYSKEEEEEGAFEGSKELSSTPDREGTPVLHYWRI